MKALFLCIILLVNITADVCSFAEEGFNYDAKGKRDPFVPKESGGINNTYGISGIKDIRLEGIIWDETKGSMAIINGDIVREGQNIGKVKVIKIENTRVTFDSDGEEIQVELVQEDK